MCFVASQGKLSRQIANLKQNLKHTADQTMNLDTAIEQRKREIDDVTNDITNEREQNESYQQNLRQVDLEVMKMQLDKARVNFTNQKFKTMGDRYNEIATSK